MMKEANQPGILFGVGVGPGDPELITVKALRALERCSVIAYPKTRGETNLALDIVRRAGIPLEGKTLLPLLFPMTRDKEELLLRHDEAAAAVTDKLSAGENVAVLNLGDVSLYSTFSYLLTRVKRQGFQVEIIPGVPSFCAAAALLQRSLTAMKEPLHIIPAGYEGSLDALSLPGSKVIMKSGNTLPALCQMMDDLGLLPRAALVENAGLPGERIVASLSRETESSGYFTTILIGPEEKEGSL